MRTNPVASDKSMTVFVAFHRATPWLIGLAWLALLTLALLPVIANIVDPLPPLAPADTGNLLSVSRYVFEATFRALERLWVPFAAAGLCLLVTLLTLSAWILNTRVRPISRLLLVVGLPLPSLLLAFAVALCLQ